MFEYRLGLALGKTVQEIRTMPAPEYEGWYLFYQVEPFGFHDREYRTGSILAMMNNTTVGKKGKQKKSSDFMRDIPKSVLEGIEQEDQINDRKKLFDSLSDEEKKEFIARDLSKILGKVVKIK